VVTEVVVLGVDPGRDKCGVAVLTEGKVLQQEVVLRNRFLGVVRDLVKEYNVEVIVLGDGTGSAEFRAELQEQLPDMRLITVDERHTTEEARNMYWIEHRPKGLKRLLPTTMQVPPEPYDDYVAVILAQRFLDQK
jgi:RNase H-fold protein (predicted Holliday junction resolvase)